MLFLAVATAAPATGQTGLYVPAKGPVRNMQKALHNPEVFYLLLNYSGSSPTYSVSDLICLTRPTALHSTSTTPCSTP